LPTTIHPAAAIAHNGGVRKIVHIDMDAFYASVEQRDDPSLRGRPVVVAWKGARSVVCAASYEARKFGIRSAMPALRAERLCPSAVFVPPDFSRYRAVSKQVRGIFERHTDLIEPLSLDEAYLDVTENKLGLSSATAVATAIRDAIREETRLTASAGIAPNKFLAKIASDWRKPDGQFVIRPKQVDAFLLPLPVSKLHGVGRVMESKLAAIGIQTVGQLRALGAVELERRWGSWGRRLHELSCGIDDSAVVSERQTVQVSAEDTFATDVLLRETEPTLRHLAGKVWEAAKKEQGRVGRTVVLKLKTSDFQVVSRSLTPPVPPATPGEFARIAIGLLDRVDLPARTRYRLAGVGLANFRDEHDIPPALFA
jgi:DNA polymerase-4